MLDLTQREFGDYIGIKQNSIALIESGKRNASNQVIRSICREFNVNEEWLRYGTGEMFASDISNELDTLVKMYKSGRNVNDRIKALRKSLDLTQEAFASRIGSVQNTITGYESGRRNPSSPVISLICREFNVNEEWLRYGTGKMFLQDTNDELDALAERYDLTYADRVFVEKFVNLNADRRGMFISFMSDVITALDNDPDKKEGGLG